MKTNAQMDAPVTGLKALPIPTEEGELARVKAENMALRRELAAVQALAYGDALTGLHNRRYFDKRLSEQISLVRRRPGQGFSLIIMDMNDFKEINDSCGHAVGDKVLKWIGAFLAENLRAHDICCRWGGDEFAVLLPNTDAERCADTVLRLKSTLSAANAGRDQPLRISFGAACWPDQGTSAEKLLAAADENMYRDKRRQKARAA